ncbi:MAG TPA: hypothetical protein VFP85_06665 [Vicinamibacterales bacterium]|nr:hypothetical protein [Vicinamibacterales bacterium]
MVHLLVDPDPNGDGNLSDARMASIHIRSRSVFTATPRAGS